MRDDPPEFEPLRSAGSLADLADLMGTDSVHDAYFDAKEVWRREVGRRQAGRPRPEGLAGDRVTVDGTDFHVHGITHADTAAEREHLREHVRAYVDRGAAVYCEQGIRRMYFDDFPDVCAMDDYRWAMSECERLDLDSHVGALPETGLGSVLEDVAAVADDFREATFSLIESGRQVYGERFERALGDVAAGFLTGHADTGVGNSYEAFRLSREASQNPEKLHELQQYYERTFLPQPLEREWLRGHDPELELVSHARNERMADYVVYHNRTAAEVHVIAGAAHQPGLVYYLDRYREGREVPASFEPL